jgi:hypothetical protein
MNYTVKGKIKLIKETQIFDSGFQKREFVVTVEDGQYPQHIQLEMTKENCDKLNNFKPNEIVEVSFFLNGREWESPKDGTTKYFNSLVAWKIDYAGAHADAIHDQTLTAAQMGDDSDQDLPF